MTQVSESDYRRAQQGDARVRQEFLDAIDLEDARDFVGRITYCGSADYPKKDMELARLETNPLPFVKSHLIVFPELFDCSYNYVFSMLIDHEGYHARQKKCDLVGDLIRIFLSSSPAEKANRISSQYEIEAITNQLANAEKRKLTDIQIKSLEEDRRGY